MNTELHRRAYQNILTHCMGSVEAVGLATSAGYLHVGVERELRQGIEVFDQVRLNDAGILEVNGGFGDWFEVANESVNRIVNGQFWMGGN